MTFPSVFRAISKSKSSFHVFWPNDLVDLSANIITGTKIIIQTP